MIHFAIALVISDPTGETLPSPQTYYHQAFACAASAHIEQEAGPTAEEGEFTILDEEILTWGVIAGHLGPAAGRSPNEVDWEDLDNAVRFYREMREWKPLAFAAHRTYCRALLP